jgi:hypothetical protein
LILIDGSTLEGGCRRLSNAAREANCSISTLQRTPTQMARTFHVLLNLVFEFEARKVQWLIRRNETIEIKVVVIVAGMLRRLCSQSCRLKCIVYTIYRATQCPLGVPAGLTLRFLYGQRRCGNHYLHLGLFSNWEVLDFGWNLQLPSLILYLPEITHQSQQARLLNEVKILVLAPQRSSDVRFLNSSIGGGLIRSPRR